MLITGRRRRRLPVGDGAVARRHSTFAPDEIDDLLPLRGLGGDDLAEVLRRAGDRLAAELGQALAHLRVGQRPVHLGVDLLDDRRAACPWACRCRTRPSPRSRAPSRRPSAACGIDGSRSCRRDGERAQLAALDVADRRRQVVEQHVHLAAHQVDQRRAGALVRHVQHLAAGHRLEQLAREVHRGAAARRRHVDLARVGLAVGDELGDGLGRERRRHLHHVGRSHQAGDRRDVADEVEAEVLVERRVDAVGRVDEQHRVAVRRRVDDRLDAEVVAGARLVLDHERLAHLLGQPLRDDARQHVGRAGRRVRDDPLDRPGRVVGGLGGAARAGGEGAEREGEQATESIHGGFFPGGLRAIRRGSPSFCRGGAAAGPGLIRLPAARPSPPAGEGTKQGGLSWRRDRRMIRGPWPIRAPTPPPLPTTTTSPTPPTTPTPTRRPAS